MVTRLNVLWGWTPAISKRMTPNSFPTMWQRRRRQKLPQKCTKRKPNQHASDCILIKVSVCYSLHSWCQQRLSLLQKSLDAVCLKNQADAASTRIIIWNHLLPDHARPVAWKLTDCCCMHVREVLGLAAWPSWSNQEIKIKSISHLFQAPLMSESFCLFPLARGSGVFGSLSCRRQGRICCTSQQAMVHLRNSYSFLPREENTLKKRIADLLRFFPHNKNGHII